MISEGQSEGLPGLRWRALPTPTLPPATTTNHYVVGEARVILVDPATPTASGRLELDAWLNALPQQVTALLLSHHHRDHVGGAAYLAKTRGLPIWAHAATARLLEGTIAIDRLIVDGEEVATNADGSSWRALHTPGHAAGHLALWHEASAAVVAGDLVAGQGTILIDPSDGDMQLYLASLQRVEDLQPSILYPAHGPVLADAVGLLRHYRAHRLAREARILGALTREPTDPADLLPVAYGDVARVAWPLALRSMRAHLTWMERKGLAAKDGERWRRLPA